MCNGCKLTSEDTMSQTLVGHKMGSFKASISFTECLWFSYIARHLSFSPPKGLGKEVNDQLVSTSASPFFPLGMTELTRFQTLNYLNTVQWKYPPSDLLSLTYSETRTKPHGSFYPSSYAYKQEILYIHGHSTANDKNVYECSL
jgi:hypothetical protein